MTSSIITLNSQNYQDAFAIQQTCHLFPWSEAVFCDAFTPPYFSLSLVDETGTTQGYAVGMYVLNECTLMDIGVAEDFRGRGLAKTLLDAVISHAIKQQCDELWLEVRVSNAAAIALYSKANFETIEERKNYYPTKIGRENGLVMRRRL